MDPTVIQFRVHENDEQPWATARAGLTGGQLSSRKHAVHHSIAAEAIKYFSIAIILVSDHEGTRLPWAHQMQRLDFEPRIAQRQRKSVALTIERVD
jgi:DeoR/GlpR family transcriptional regulator of sugar metabolism